MYLYICLTSRPGCGGGGRKVLHNPLGGEKHTRAEARIQQRCDVATYERAPLLNAHLVPRNHAPQFSSDTSAQFPCNFDSG